MNHNRKKICNIQVNEGAAWLISLNVGKLGVATEMIEAKNAEQIVEKFRDDPYIIANIQNDTLHVSARYPIVTVDCRYPGELSRPLVYTLKK